MADTGEISNRLDPNCFLQTFLNVKENSKGYNEASIRGGRTRMVKALITPFRRGGFIEECSVLAPPNGCFGRRMFEFAWNNSSLFKTENSQSQGDFYGYESSETTSKFGTVVSQECACVSVGNEKHFGSLHYTQQTSSDNVSSNSKETSIYKRSGSVDETICSNPLFNIGNCLQNEGNLPNNSSGCEDDDIGEHVFDTDIESGICDISNDNMKDNNFATERHVSDIDKQNSGTTTSCLIVARGNLQDLHNDQLSCNASETGRDHIYSKISGRQEGSFQWEKDYLTSNTTLDLHLDNLTDGGTDNHITHNVLDHVTNGISYFDEVISYTKENQLSPAVSGAKNNSLGHITSGVVYGTNCVKGSDLDHMTNSAGNHGNGNGMHGSENNHLAVTNGTKNNYLDHVTKGSTDNSIVHAHSDEPNCNEIVQQQQKLLSSQSISTDRPADISVKFTISLLDSILIGSENQDKAISYDYELYGKLAVLLGFLSSSNPTVFQITHTLSVGLFDFLDGTVRPHEYSEAIINQFLSTIKARTLGQVMEELQISFRKHFTLPKQVAITNQNMRMSLNSVPVGWVITSPGLGVGLDRQLKEKLVTVLEGPLVGTTLAQHECDGEKWQHLLMLLDEYRRCDDGTPLIEVYELSKGGDHKLVNFEIL